LVTLPSVRYTRVSSGPVVLYRSEEKVLIDWGPPLLMLMKRLSLKYLVSFAGYFMTSNQVIAQKATVNCQYSGFFTASVILPAWELINLIWEHSDGIVQEEGGPVVTYHHDGSDSVLATVYARIDRDRSQVLVERVRKLVRVHRFSYEKGSKKVKCDHLTDGEEVGTEICVCRTGSVIPEGEYDLEHDASRSLVIYLV